MEEKEEVLKIAVFGDSNVGKSALTRQYISGTFISEHDPTVQDNYKFVDTVDGKTISLEIYDTGGIQEFSSVRDTVIPLVDAYLLVYDTTKQTTFTHLRSLHSTILDKRKYKHFPAVIVGTRKDLTSFRTVRQDEVVSWASNLVYRHPVIEISVMNKLECSFAFKQLVREFRYKTTGEKIDTKGIAQFEVEIPKSTFVQDMNSMIKEVSSDIQVFLEGDVKVPTFKSFLAAASPVFQQLILEKEAENSNAQLSINLPLNSSLFQALLDFLIFGTLPKSGVKQLEEMKELAIKYKIKRLEEECDRISGKVALADGLKQLLVKVEDIIENIINSAYPDRDVYRVIDEIKKKYMEIIYIAIEFYCKVEVEYYNIDDDQRVELSYYIVQKGITIVRTIIELGQNLVGRYGREKLADILRIELADFVLEKTNNYFLKKIKEFALRLKERKARLQPITKKLEEDPSISVGTTRGIEWFRKKLEKLMKFLPKLQKGSKDFDEGVQQLTQKLTDPDDKHKKQFTEAVEHWEKLSTEAKVSGILRSWEKLHTGRKNLFIGGLKPELIQAVIDVIDDQKFTDTFNKMIEYGRTLPDHPTREYPTNQYVSIPLNNKELSNVAFIVEEKPIYAYKPILIARCEHFRIMFTRDWKESKQREVEIPNYSASAIKYLLEYLYTDYVDKNIELEVAVELLVCAQEFQIGRLKAICEFILGIFVNSDNITELYQVAEMHDCQQLRKKCIEFALAEISNNFSHLEYDSLPQTLQTELFAAKAVRDKIIDEQKQMEQAFIFLPSEIPEPEKKKKKKKRSKK